jgi:hypothetical protein
MASESKPHRARCSALLPALAVVGILAGCGSGGTSAVALASPASGVIVPPAAAPVVVTVAPASVAPGATGTAVTMPAVVTAPTLPTPGPAPNVAPCPESSSPKQVAVRVSPAPGSAVVAWLGDGDRTVRSYRVSAISQRLVAGTQPAAPSVTTASGVGCGPRSVILRGLRHRTPYVFWLEEGSPDPAGGLRYWLVGRTIGVLVP